MAVGEIAEPVDLLVVGAGPGGYVAALRAAELGRKVTLVDRDGKEGGTGGVCLRVGCIPSKALIELAERCYQADGLRRFGVKNDNSAIDLPAFQEWKESIVERLSAAVDRLLAQQAVRRLSGDLRFVRLDRAAVAHEDGASTFLEFSQAVVATGSRPRALPHLPFDGVRVVSSSEILGSTSIPPSVAVVGAGYIGLELGTALAKLGSAVTVVEAEDRVLPGLDRSVARPIARRLAELGITLALSAEAVDLDDHDLCVRDPSGERRVPADKVLVAVGRVPNTDDLGLGHLGVDVGPEGLIRVDGGRMASPTVAAIGDVTSGPALAHKASAEARVAAERLCGLPALFDPMAIPVVVFTDPEVAVAGLSESEARAEGMDVAVSAVPVSATGRALILGGTDGSTRLVVDRATDRVVGAQLVGPHASELIAEVGLAIEMTASPLDVAETVHAHPTLSESVQLAARALVRTETNNPKGDPG